MRPPKTCHAPRGGAARVRFLLCLLSRADPCTVDFGCETPKFQFKFCCGFLVLFFPKEKGPPKSTKNPPTNSPGSLFEKIRLGFLQKPLLEGKTPENLREFVENMLLSIFGFWTAVSPHDGITLQALTVSLAPLQQETGPKLF